MVEEAWEFGERAAGEGMVVHALPRWKWLVGWLVEAAQFARAGRGRDGRWPAQWSCGRG